METTIVQEPTTTENNTQQPSIHQMLGDSLWGVKTPAAPVVVQEQAPVVAQQESAPAATTTATTEVEPEVISPEEWLKREFQYENLDTFRTEWSELRKLKEQPRTEEFRWANDESKRLAALINEGKRDELRRALNQQADLERLEGYDVSDVNQATEIIKANLQFKYKDLSPQEINRLYTRQYSIPEKPVRDMDQTDDDYAQEVASWQRQVQEKEMDIMIEAKMAKPELANYKSQIVLPDIPQPQVQQTGPSQEDLAAMEAGRLAYLKAVESEYQKFSGFTVTAKDGDVQLPISYTIAPEENVASRQLLENFNTDSFFNDRWFDEKGSPRVTAIQEDLYLLQNRDRIFQKIANEAVAQATLNRLKVQNNIKVDGVTTTAPVAQEHPKSVNEQLAEAVWKKR